MKARILAATATALLLTAPVVALSPDGIAVSDAAAKGKHKDKGLQILAADYDASAGTMTVDMRWQKQELRKPGDDAGHLTVLGQTADGQVVVRDEPVALDREHRLRHVIRLTTDEQALIAGSATLRLAATHKHDDDDGLYDRAWYDLAEVDGAALQADPGDDTHICLGPFGPNAALSHCLLTGVNMSGMDLSGADLSYANLVASNLTGTSLSGTNLSSAILKNAILKDANLANTNLTNAMAQLVDMRNTWIGSATLNGADLSGANLTGAVSDGVWMTDARLINATLASAKLAGSVLTGSDLTGSDLTGADLSESTAQGINLTGVHAQQVNLRENYLQDATMVNGDFSSGDLSRVYLGNANLTGANLTGANLDDADYCHTTMPDGSQKSNSC